MREVDVYRIDNCHLQGIRKVKAKITITSEGTKIAVVERDKGRQVVLFHADYARTIAEVRKRRERQLRRYIENEQKRIDQFSRWLRASQRDVDRWTAIIDWMRLGDDAVDPPAPGFSTNNE